MLKIEPKKTGKLSLHMVKTERYRVDVSWQGKHDIDIHAIVCYRETVDMDAKASTYDDILSCYNVRRRIRGVMEGHLPLNADNSFQIHNGALTHSPDATDGDGHVGNNSGDPDEYIDVNIAKLPSPSELGLVAIEIPIIVTIHDEHNTLRFKDVKNVEIRVLDSNNNVVYQNNISANFDKFSGVQIGTIMMTADETRFMDINTGFNNGFNGVLEHFS